MISATNKSFYFYTREASKHQRCVSVFVLVAVDIGSMLQKQFAHVRLSLVGCVHERTHPILTRNSTKKPKGCVLCNCTDVMRGYFCYVTADPRQAAGFDKQTDNSDKQDMKCTG